MQAAQAAQAAQTSEGARRWASEAVGNLRVVSVHAALDVVDRSLDEAALAARDDPLDVHRRSRYRASDQGSNFSIGGKAAEPFGKHLRARSELSQVEGERRGDLNGTRVDLYHEPARVLLFRTPSSIGPSTRRADPRLLPRKPSPRNRTWSGLGLGLGLGLGPGPGPGPGPGLGVRVRVSVQTHRRRHLLAVLRHLHPHRRPLALLYGTP